jgi:hypothetical protein
MKTKKTTLAQEFIQRIDPLRQEVGWVGKTGNVAEINPSGLVVLPKEKETVLNVLELVIQPADGKFGICDSSGRVTANDALDSGTAPDIGKDVMGVIGPVDRYRRGGAAVDTQLSEELS